jgi:hypothetical protein
LKGEQEDNACFVFHFFVTDCSNGLLINHKHIFILAFKNYVKQNFIIVITTDSHSFFLLTQKKKKNGVICLFLVCYYDKETYTLPPNVWNNF